MEEVGRSHWLFLGPFGFILLCLCVPVLPIQNASCITKGTRTVCEGEFNALPEGIPTAVTDLDVSKNLLTSVEHNTLITFVNIKKLNISRNSISRIHNKAFFRLSDLELLDISFNHLTEISDDILFNNVKLKWFSIAHNNLKYIPQLQSKSLQMFNVSSCRIQDMNETTFQDIESIKVLDLSFNEITEIQNHTFDALTMLHELDVSNNKLQNAHFINSDCSLSLTYLEISSNNISVLDLETLQTLLTLKQVHFHNNPWRCDENMKFVYKNMLRNEFTLNLKCVSVLDKKEISWHEWYYSIMQVNSCPVSSTSPTTCVTNTSKTCPNVLSSCDTVCTSLYIIYGIMIVVNVAFGVGLILKTKKQKKKPIVLGEAPRNTAG